MAAFVSRWMAPRLKSAWGVISASMVSWWQDDVFTLAAAIAFYTIFSLAPILLISVSIAGLVFSEEKAKYQVIQEIENLTGAEGARVAEQIFNNMIDLEKTSWALLYGILAIIIGSTAVFASLQSALNHIWRVEPRTDRSALKAVLRVRLRSFGIVLTVGFLLLVSMVISALLNGIEAFVAESWQGLPWIWKASNMLLSFAVITVLFALIYKYLPDAVISWRQVLTGAFLTALLFSFGKFLIGIYLGQVALGSAYGAAGSFVVLLIWIYYSSLILFMGAEFTKVTASRRNGRIRPQKHARRK